MTAATTDRASRIRAILPAYDAATGDPCRDRDEALVFLLTDLQHYAETEGLDFEDALAQARYHYNAETEGPSPLPVNLAGRLDLTKYTILA